mmetsp:Transcript_60591/g.131337  ORF Transcript_60591/g.131337 Transcript_60591/m.131337 type:complete len:228 (-) Transcript_60591:544-1227(-)
MKLQSLACSGQAKFPQLVPSGWIAPSREDGRLLQRELRLQQPRLQEGLDRPRKHPLRRAQPTRNGGGCIVEGRRRVRVGAHVGEEPSDFARSLLEHQELRLRLFRQRKFDCLADRRLTHAVAGQEVVRYRIACVDVGPVRQGQLGTCWNGRGSPDDNDTTSHTPSCVGSLAVVEHRCMQEHPQPRRGHLSRVALGQGSLLRWPKAVPGQCTEGIQAASEGVATDSEL